MKQIFIITLFFTFTVSSVSADDLKKSINKLDEIGNQEDCEVPGKKIKVCSQMYKPVSCSKDKKSETKIFSNMCMAEQSGYLMKECKDSMKDVRVECPTTGPMGSCYDWDGPPVDPDTGIPHGPRGVGDPVVQK
jgi:hypothetical protein